MKQIHQHILCWMALLIAGVSSCSSPDLPEPVSSLELSHQELVLDASSSTASIEIKGTQDQWSYLLGVQWLACTQSGKTLKIEAQPNQTGRTRSTTIIIKTATDVARLLVTQSFGGSAISAERSSYSISQWGGELAIPIHTNSHNWEASVSEDWLEAYPNTAKGELIVRVSESLIRDTRSASIVLRESSSGESFILEVNQSGVLYMLLPYLKFGDNIGAIQTFEEARRSQLVGQPGTPGDSPFDKPNTDLWKFKTQSPLFTRIEYRIPRDKLTEVDVYCSLEGLTKELANIHQYLLDQGFVERSDLNYYNRTLETSVTIGRAANGREGQLHYVYTPAQPTPQPTFDTFPGGIVTEQGDWTSNTKEKIHTWETNHQGETSNPDGVLSIDKLTLKLTYFPSNDDASDLSMTYYTLSTDPSQAKNPLIRVQHFYKDEEATTKKFFWIKDGSYILTDEFVELARKANFIFVKKDNYGQHIFYNSKQETICAVRAIISSPGSTLKPFVSIEFIKNN